MFEIGCISLSEASDVPEIVAALHSVPTVVSSEVPVSSPAFQFDYKAVGLENVKRVFSYAGIAITNTPIGVDGSFDPIADAGEWVVFPLSGLRRHFAVIAEDTVQEFDRLESLDQLIESRGASITPCDELVAASLECFLFCQRHKLMFTIAW